MRAGWLVVSPSAYLSRLFSFEQPVVQDGLTTAAERLGAAAASRVMTGRFVVAV